jgi:hypothetical protein
MQTYMQIAVTFASALVAGEFEKAHALLAPSLQTRLTPDKLREELVSMWSGYAAGPATEIYFNENSVLQDWHDRLPEDLGMAFIGISGRDFHEAITVLVSDINGKPLIRDIEWGRP